MYLTQQDWIQFKKNIEEGQEKSTRIIVELHLEGYEEKEQFYIDWAEYEEVGIVPVTTCLLGTYNELLYNYFGDEPQKILYLDDEENQRHREIIVAALIKNKQVPIRYFVTGVEFNKDNDKQVKLENADYIEVAILEQPPEQYFAELLYKDGNYEVKIEQ